MTDWISVKDRLPEANALCVVWNENRPCNLLIAIYSVDCNEWMHYDYSNVLAWPLVVTHWIEIQPMER